MSQFIQINAFDVHDSLALYALDDEGTIWWRNPDTSEFDVLYRSVTEPKPKPARKAREPKQPFEEWFAEIQANPIYAYINWPVEIEKMKDWFKRHPSRRMTERFVLQWIYKIEAPIPLDALVPKVCPNRIRKEGKSFMQVCGKPATSVINRTWCCSDCYDEISRRAK